MLKNRIGWGILIVLAVALLICTNTYYAAWLLIAVILIPLVSAGFMLIASGKLFLELHLAPIMEKNEDTGFYYLLRNDSRLPIARVSFDTVLENQMTFSRSKKRSTASVQGRNEARSEFEITNPLTGTTTVNTRRIRVEDAFGIFSIRRGNLPESVTVIYPAFRDVAVFLNRPVETLGDGRRWAQDRKGNDVSEVFNIREYAAGDEVRRIHWKLSEKLDKTMVRDFSLPLNYSVFLLLELTKADEEIMDRALEIYVSISRVLMEKGIHHNMAWYDGAEKMFHVRELKDFGDMEIALSQMLSACAYETENTALDHYIESVYCDPRNTLLYIGTKPDEERLAELAVRQQVRVIDAGEENIDEIWI